MYRALLLFGLFLTHSNFSTVSVVTQRWGFFAHKKINRLAVFSVPDPLFDFYRLHIDYLTEHAVDPDKRRYAVKGEAECHFIDFDRYAASVVGVDSILPRSWELAVAEFGEDSLRSHGIAPWNTWFTYHKLVDAFRKHDLGKILRHSADLGHYIGDIHVPLHTTRNYNGQLTGQQGIHGFWETRLPELFSEDYDLIVPTAGYVFDLQEKIWQALRESHLAVDSVLSFESELSREDPAKFSMEESPGGIQKKYSAQFAAKYHSALAGMVERRMRAAISLLAACWYSAWIDAGQPDLLTISSEKINFTGDTALIGPKSQRELRFHE